jgi:beta-glucosidase
VEQLMKKQSKHIVLPIVLASLFATSPALSGNWFSNMSFFVGNIMANRQKKYQKEGLNVVDTNPTTPTALAARFSDGLKKWKRINPDQFIFGASTSEHQCSQQCTADSCTWALWAEQRNIPRPGDPEFGTIDLWNNYQSYIDYARDQLHLTTLRFSVEWALVEPREGQFDTTVLQHYADQFTYCIKRGITPVVCFHHYTDPRWFLEEKNGFEERKNKEYFARYCAVVYKTMVKQLARAIDNNEIGKNEITAFQQRPPLFATFNSPEGYAFKGYYKMEAPPSNPDKKGLDWVMRVLGNMMVSHVAVYKSMNAAFNELSPQEKQRIRKPMIGFLKNITQTDPSKNGIVNKAISHIACNFGDMLQNEAIYQFFTTGAFRSWPVGNEIKDKNAPQSLDFIGLNYYSNCHLDFRGKEVEEPADIQTDNKNYCFYPEGLYRAVMEISKRLALPVGGKKVGYKKSIPIYVTENGIATADDARRNLFYEKYLSALAKAIEDGCDVRGYLTWTLADNYEWQKVTTKRGKNHERRVYGLCTVDKNQPGQLIAKDGAEFYTSLAHAFQPSPNAIQNTQAPLMDPHLRSLRMILRR